MSTCKYHDPHCPCQDGDACHYEDCGDTKAMDPRYVLAAHIADLTVKLAEAEARLRDLREWITAAHHLPLCAKWSYALDDQMQIAPALVHDAECTCGRDSALAKSAE